MPSSCRPIFLLLALLLPSSPLFLRRPPPAPRDSQERTAVCREYAARQADLVPSYCNREEVEEAAVPRARQMNGWGWAEWTEWGGCGSCPRASCPSSCRMRCRYCKGVCEGQASELDNCPALSKNDTITASTTEAVFS